MADDLSLKHELCRKLIHFAVSIIPILLYFWNDGEPIVVFTVCLAIGFLIVDILRMRFGIVRKYFRRIFLVLLRQDESEDQLTGATYLFLGISTVFIVFERNIAVCSALLATVADPMAAIVGKRFGSIAIYSKSLQGSIAFLITAIMITILFFGINWQVLIIAVLVTIVELLPININDNLAIPAVAGAGLYIAL